MTTIGGDTVNSMGRKAVLKRLGRAVAGLGLTVFLLYITGEAYSKKDFLPYFLDRKSDLASVVETVLETGPDWDVVHLLLADEKGIEVEAHLRVPHAPDTRRRALVILGGVGTGKRTVDYLGDTGDWLVMALDYPYRGPRSGLSRGEFLAALPAIRRAVLDTVPASMLAVDYLERRGDVDPNRIVLAGGSFGALFTPALAAADERISAVAIFFGAGDLHALIDANLELWWPLKPVASWLGWIIVSPLEPLKYAHRISPRPIFMLNGTGDEAIPEASAWALHDRAGEPKTVVWLPVGHVNIRSPEFHRQVLDEFVSWLRSVGVISADETFKLLPAGSRVDEQTCARHPRPQIVTCGSGASLMMGLFDQGGFDAKRKTAAADRAHFGIHRGHRPRPVRLPIHQP